MLEFAPTRLGHRGSIDVESIRAEHSSKRAFRFAL
jgi:hypothetical protein